MESALSSHLERVDRLIRAIDVINTEVLALRDEAIKLHQMAPSHESVYVPARATVSVSVPARATVSVPARATVSVPARATTSVPARATTSVPARATTSASVPVSTRGKGPLRWLIMGSDADAKVGLQLEDEAKNFGFQGLKKVDSSKDADVIIYSTAMSRVHPPALVRQREITVNRPHPPALLLVERARETAMAGYNEVNLDKLWYKDAVFAESWNGTMDFKPLLEYITQSKVSEISISAQDIAQPGGISLFQ
jgi:hypothetical protein